MSETVVDRVSSSRTYAEPTPDRALLNHNQLSRNYLTQIDPLNERQLESRLSYHARLRKRADRGMTLGCLLIIGGAVDGVIGIRLDNVGLRTVLDIGVVVGGIFNLAHTFREYMQQDLRFTVVDKLLSSIRS